ncbi:MAG TPA: thiamine-phosphate kinase [Sphingobium sp.]|uniref:thiamine-phosphate kinase n=1 Tax=Sphingobium sp. TaxID=1912891 RepID=UPI002ED1FEF4
MTREADFIAALRGIATHPAARGLMDDAAVLPVGDMGVGGAIVLTHDMMVEGVHYLPDDTPADVAWKLLAVNLSDLAAKGAVPLGVLLGYAMTDDGAWDAAFAAGLGTAAAALGVPVLGGDTVRMPAGAPRALGLTALGRAPASGAPSRSGARPGDLVYVSGTIGDAGAGLAIRLGRARGDAALVRRYTRPEPRLALGQAIAPYVTAMADVSDGLLIDASRMAKASGCAIHLDLDLVPLSDALRAMAGDSLEARLAAASAGDDYELLFTAPPGVVSDPGVTPIGRVEAGEGLVLRHGGQVVPLPGRLGYEHDA